MKADAESLPVREIAPARWFHFLILIALLLAGTVLRFHRIDEQSLGLDEFWAVYLATGRGNTVLETPSAVRLDPPPASGFVDAPPFWKIWGGLYSVVHPPLYYLSLRWWIDLFGDSDLATRSLSAVMSLASIILLFEIIRRRRGAWPALIAASLMTLGVTQIDYSQQTRPYTLMVFLGLLAVAAMLHVEKRGPTTPRLISLGFAVLLLAMTHYLCMGALAGLGIYALLRFRGRQRKAVVATMLLAVLIFTFTWGPFLWSARKTLANTEIDPTSGGIISNFFVVPQRLLIGSDKLGIFAVLLALLVFVLPLWRLKTSRDTLIWWLWVTCSPGFVAVFDLAALGKRPPLLGYDKYVFLAWPGICALIADSLDRPWRIPSWLAWMPAILVVAVTAYFAIARYSAGPQPSLDWKTPTRQIDHRAGSRDLLVFIDYGTTGPQYDFIVFEHYAHITSRPIMLIRKPEELEKVNVQKAAEPWQFWLIRNDRAPGTSGGAR